MIDKNITKALINELIWWGENHTGFEPSISGFHRAVGEVMSYISRLESNLQTAECALAEMTVKYECNTAILMARTKKMNEYFQRLTEAESQLDELKNKESDYWMCDGYFVSNDLMNAQLDDCKGLSIPLYACPMPQSAQDSAGSDHHLVAISNLRAQIEAHQEAHAEQIAAENVQIRKQYPIGTNAGHGHVWARPDGMKARCGGAGICGACSLDAAAVKNAN